MAFRSLHQLINRLEQQSAWQSHRRLQTILTCWPAAVGDAVAQRTRPVAIQGDCLQVAVSSAVWAQNLTFERQRILEKINVSLLDKPLRDIRFSTAQWHRAPTSKAATAQDDNAEILSLWANHPCQIGRAQHDPRQPLRPAALQSKSRNRLDPRAEHPLSDAPQTAEDAFQAWTQAVKGRSQHLPLCPTCQCPTPEGELMRWSVCALCAAKGWKSF